MTRRQEREQAFILIFEKEFNEDIDINELYETAVETQVIKARDYTKNLVKNVFEKCDEIDNKIQEHSISWDKKRISKVSLAILRLAICEILFIEDVPTSVSINEAVELCKKFASPKDATFVNGVLGTFAKALNKEN